MHCCWERQRWRRLLLLLGCVGALGGWLQAMRVHTSSLILPSVVAAFLLCSQGAARYENGGMYVGEFANDVRSGWGELVSGDSAAVFWGASSRLQLASACRCSELPCWQSAACCDGLSKLASYPYPAPSLNLLPLLYRHALLPKQRQIRGRVGGRHHDR